MPFGGIDVSGYTPTDGYFGAAYINADEWRETSYPHRHVHGGFADTDTRFTFYFTPTDDYQGRLSTPRSKARTAVMTIPSAARGGEPSAARG